VSRGVDVTALAAFVAPELEQLGVKAAGIGALCRRPHLIKVRQFTNAADRYLRQHGNQYDVVQAFGYTVTRPHGFNNSQFVHAAWRSMKATAESRDRFPYGLYQFVYTRLNAIWENVAYASAGVVIASSGIIAQQLVKIGVPEAKIRIIHNGVDTTEFSPGVGVRGKYGLPEAVPMALFAGDLRTTRKNLDSVLKAMQRVPALHLAVLGDTVRSPFPRMARELGIDARVHFLGFRRDVAGVMRSVDAFVFPSRYEACSLVILEAMASGLPVITAASAGGSELVDRSAGIVLRDADDVPSLAQALAALFKDRQEVRRLGRGARSIARRYTWSKMSDDYLGLYREMAGCSSTNGSQTIAPRA
jgi:glycosyltransferase involved in cell wall biosynthesis